MRTWVLVYSTRSRRSHKDDSADLVCELGTLAKAQYAALGLRPRARLHVQSRRHGILVAIAVVNDSMPSADFDNSDRIYHVHPFHLMELLEPCNILLVTNSCGSKSTVQ